MTDKGVDSPFSQIDHYPVYVTVNIARPAIKVRSRTIRDYHLLDADKLTNQLMQTDWDAIFSQNIDEATVEFTNAILKAADSAIPTRTIRVKPNNKRW